MEVIERTIKFTSRSFKLFVYPYSDAHLGSPGCAETSLIHKVKECANLGKNAVAIGVGDWADCITSKDKRWNNNCIAPWVERTNIVESQRERIKAVFSPLVEQGQLLGIGTGNHEEAIHESHDDDLVRNVCKDLKTPYAGYHCFYVLHFERCGKRTHSLTIHAWHGSGAAQSEGARVMRLMRLVNEFEADIYLMGHLHAKSTYETARLGLSNGRIWNKPIKAAITGSWLKAYDQPDEGQESDPSYVEKKGYKPAVIGMPVIEITPDNYNNPNEPEFEIKS